MTLKAFVIFVFFVVEKYGLETELA